MASTLHPFNGPDRGSGFGRFTYQYQEPTPFRHRGGLLFKLTQQVGNLRAGCLDQIAPPCCVG